jgi:hypothetical protein
MPRQAIQAQSEALNIPYLVHFTRAVNLPSILEHGLYPISRKDELGINPQVNDQMRLDGHLDGISLFDSPTTACSINIEGKTLRLIG